MSNHSSATAIPSIPDGVKLVTLDNGLIIITREDHSAPVVSAQAWAMTGSVHEGRWLGAGLSHVLEHMLFKGTTTRPGSRIDQEVQEAGGYMNAYTSFDRTVYHIDVPNTGARVAIDILCDIMQHAALPPDDLAKEDRARGSFKPTDISYSLARQTLIASNRPGMAIWREKLFAMMVRNAESAMEFFALPTNRVVELGSQVEI